MQSCVKAIAAPWALLALSCASGDGSPAPSAIASGGALPATTSSASSSSPSAASASPSAHAATSPTGAAATLTREEFCAHAVELGEANLAKCADSEKANVPSMGHVKSLASASKECSMRVASQNVEFQPEVAHRCIEAARQRGGRTTFFSFDLVPACSGVLTGKAAEGQPALFAEECALGLAKVENRCVRPVARNARCDDYPGGLLGTPDEHPRCEAGLACFMTNGGGDGNQAQFACLPPSESGARCKLYVNTCAQGSSCYQGRCREQASLGGECMSEGDCLAGHSCEIQGGVFGRCVARSPIPETCGPTPR